MYHVIVEKAQKATMKIGMRKFQGKEERKRESKRRSGERKREKAENIRLYGSDLDEE